MRRAMIAATLVALISLNACSSAVQEPSSVAASPSTGEAATETPIPTLEATTEDASQAPAGAITITIGPGPHFVPDQLTSPAGMVTFFIDTQLIEEDVLHNMVIAPAVGDLPLAKSANLEASQSVSFTVHGLDAGTYEFWCTFPGHLEGGMRGTLTIT